LASRAFDIGRALDHAVYDCFYLALAERLSLPLITADAKLMSKATLERTSVRVLNLSNWKTVLDAD
jgi:predicted nucleic acid-binding protein